MNYEEKERWIEGLNKKWIGKRVVSKNFGFTGTAVQLGIYDPFGFGPHLNWIKVRLDTPISRSKEVGYGECSNPDTCCQHKPDFGWVASADDLVPEDKKDVLVEMKSLQERIIELGKKLKESK